MEITKELLEQLKEQCRKQIDSFRAEKPKTSTDKKLQKMTICGLKGQMMMLDKLESYLEVDT